MISRLREDKNKFPTPGTARIGHQAGLRPNLLLGVVRELATGLKVRVRNSICTGFFKEKTLSVDPAGNGYPVPLGAGEDDGGTLSQLHPAATNCLSSSHFPHKAIGFFSGMAKLPG